jgi:hypothetical protein
MVATNFSQRPLYWEKFELAKFDGRDLGQIESGTALHAS